MCTVFPASKRYQVSPLSMATGFSLCCWWSDNTSQKLLHMELKLTFSLHSSIELHQSELKFMAVSSQ